MKRDPVERHKAKQRQMLHRRLRGEASATALGYFRKSPGGGCGAPRCPLCHASKYPRRWPTRQEALAAWAERADAGG